MLDSKQTEFACTAATAEANEGRDAVEEFRGLLQQTFGVEFARLDGGAVATARSGAFGG